MYNDDRTVMQGYIARAEEAEAGLEDHRECLRSWIVSHRELKADRDRLREALEKCLAATLLSTVKQVARNALAGKEKENETTTVNSTGNSNNSKRTGDRS